MQKPVSGSWYVNRTGKLVKVSLLLYAGEIVSRVMLEYLDGNRDRAELLQEMLALHAQDVLKVEKDDQVIEDESLIKSTLAEELENQLQGLANVALLVG